MRKKSSSMSWMHSHPLITNMIIYKTNLQKTCTPRKVKLKNVVNSFVHCIPSHLNLPQNRKDDMLPGHLHKDFLLLLRYRIRLGIFLHFCLMKLLKFQMIRVLNTVIANAPNSEVLYCTVLYCTVLHCTALHCTALHCTALHCTVLYSQEPYRTVKYLRFIPILIQVNNDNIWECLFNEDGGEGGQWPVFLWPCRCTVILCFEREERSLEEKEDICLPIWSVL